MRHLYLFIHLVRQSQFRQGIVLDNQLPLLQPGNGLFYFLIRAPTLQKGLLPRCRQWSAAS